MKVYQTNDIRNIAIVGGAKSGKTTLAEAMAFESGLITRRGSVEEKNTISDYRDVEIDRRNSVMNTLLYAEYNDKKINIIDAPGFADFKGETLTAMSVCEAALVVVNATTGIEVGAEIAWRTAEKTKSSVIFVINQLDSEKSNFSETIQMLNNSFNAGLTLVQYPVNAGVGFDSIIDLVLMKLLKYPKGGGKPEVLPIPDSEKDKVEELRLQLVEAAATGSDELMEKYFETNDLPIEDVRKGLMLGIAKNSVIPVLCTSAKENIGVGRLLEFISFNVPSPDKKAVRMTMEDGTPVSYDVAAPATMFVFKTAFEAHMGELAYMKVMNGEVTESMDISNSTNQSKERLSQLLISSGKNRVKVDKVMAGDMFCTLKLKDVKANQTLVTTKNPNDKITPIEYPSPIFSVAIKAENNADDEKVGGLLNEYKSSDLSLKVEISRELKQTILSGQGELHLNIIKWYLENQAKIPVHYTSPKVPYRETITKSAEAMYRHKKQSGGSGQFGEVHMMIEPYYEGMPNQTKYPIRGTETIDLAWGGKLVFNNCIVGGAIDARFMPAILKGIMEKMEEGPLTGSYARDIVVNIYDGKMHPVDSNEMAFKIAGRTAFKEAFKNAGAKILEPISDMEVHCPAEVMGNVMTDLQGRRAIVMGMDAEGSFQVIKAKAPVVEIAKYATALSSLSSGRGYFTAKYSEYQQVPTDVQNALLKAYEESEKEEE